MHGNTHASRFSSHRPESITPMQIALPPIDIGHSKIKSPIASPHRDIGQTKAKTRTPSRRRPEANVHGSDSDKIYVSPAELADRYGVSPATVSRMAKRLQWRRVYLGYGRNGCIRYFWSDVLASEKSLTIDPKVQVTEA